MTVAVLLLGGAYVYLRVRLDQVHRLAIAHITAAAAGAPMNVLVVGSDTRAALSAGQTAQFGNAAQQTGQRSDVTFILHIDPRSKQASVLSIPRDLFVPIAGSRASNRINSAYNTGPDQLVQTIQDDFAIPINHFVQMNFDGFRGLVNAVGGINMYFPFPSKDKFSGLNITQAGCTHLNGDGALSVARSRDFEYLENGVWHYDGNGDLSRIRRQHVFIKVLMKKAISSGLGNPATANALVGQAVKDVQVDQDLGTGTILGLVNRFRTLGPNDLVTYTLPTIPVNKSGFGAVLLPQQPQDSQVVSQFLNPPIPSSGSGGSAPASVPQVSPSGVTVQVLNGSGMAGQALRAASEVAAAGFQVAGTGDSATAGHVASVVRYGPGQDAQAKLLQSEVGGSVSIQADPNLHGSNLALVTGTAFTGVHASGPASPPKSGSSASGTSAAPVPAAPAPPTNEPWDPRAC